MILPRRIVLTLLVSLVGCHDPSLSPTFPPSTKESESLPSRFVVIGKIGRFVDSVQYSMQGRRIPNGSCAWEGERTLAPGQRISERLAAYDPLTCELIIARGAYTPNMDSPGMSSRISELAVSTLFGCGSNPSPCAGNPLNCQPATPDVGRAWQMTEFLDPIDIEVTQDQIDISWRYNFECVGEISGGYHYMSWRTGTGWDIQTWHTDLTYDWNLYWTRGEGRSIYFNGTFPACGGMTVYTHHQRNWVYGFNDGFASFSYFLYTSGASQQCQDMLRPVVTTDNPRY